MSQSTKTKKPDVKESQQPQATVTEINTTQKVIKDAKEMDAGLFGHLWYDQKQILVVRGGDSTQSAFQVYNRFAQELTLADNHLNIASNLEG